MQGSGELAVDDQRMFLRTGRARRGHPLEDIWRGSHSDGLVLERVGQQKEVRMKQEVTMTQL